MNSESRFVCAPQLAGLKGVEWRYDAAKNESVPGDYVVKERACVGLAKEIEAMPDASLKLKEWARDARAFAQGSQWVFDLPSISA